VRAIVGKDICRDLDQAMVREWLDTNGCGGFASSTVGGLNTRRYHGLLVAALDPPAGRVACLASIQETATVGPQSLELGCNVYNDTIHPRGYRYLEHVQLEPYPIFTYRIDGVSLEKHVSTLFGPNPVAVAYRSSSAIDLALRPLVAMRDFHHVSRTNGSIDGTPVAKNCRATFNPYSILPEIHFDLSSGTFDPTAYWYYNFSYPFEAYRGLDSIEDLYSPGEWRCHVTPDTPVEFVTSVGEAVPPNEVFSLANVEKRRRIESHQSLTEQIEDDFERALTRASSSFVVRRKQWALHHPGGLPLVWGLGPGHHDRPSRSDPRHPTIP